MRLLQVHVTSRLGQFEEDSSSTSTDDENEIFAKSQCYLPLSQPVQKRENLIIQLGKWKDTLKKKPSILITFS